MSTLPATPPNTPTIRLNSPEVAQWAHHADLYPSTFDHTTPNPFEEVPCPPWCAERQHAEADGTEPIHYVTAWPGEMMHQSETVVVTPRTTVSVDRLDRIERCGIAVRVIAPYSRQGRASIELSTRKRGRDTDGRPAVVTQTVVFAADEVEQLIGVLETAVRLARPADWPANPNRGETA